MAVNSWIFIYIRLNLHRIKGEIIACYSLSLLMCPARVIIWFHGQAAQYHALIFYPTNPLIQSCAG